MAQLTGIKVLFSDNFKKVGPGNSLDDTKWDFNKAYYAHDGKVNPAFLGEITLMRQELPKAEKATARIRRDTWNADWQDGKSFYGSEAITKDAWDARSTGGVAFQAKMKFEGTQGGMIGGLFFYEKFGFPPPYPTDRVPHNELDWEILTSQLRPSSKNKISTNVFTHGPGAEKDYPISYPVTQIKNFSPNDWHTYRVEWLPTQVIWRIDGKVIRTEDTHLPQANVKQQLHLNLWGTPAFPPKGPWGPSPGDPGGPNVSDPTLVPATNANPFNARTNPGGNKTYYLDVKDVKVEQLSTRLGSRGTDALVGSANNDGISGGDGGDTLKGLAGDDTIWGGIGNDTIDGGDGHDTIEGGTGDDTINGGAGDDSIVGDAGDDTINGGAGNNSIVGDAGDTIVGGAGNDRIDGGAGDDTIGAGAGNDLISGGTGDDTIGAGAGNDLIGGGTGDDTISGGAGNDTISGNAGNDTIDAGEGNDRIHGGVGNDAIVGGAGNDWIHGDAGHDTINGGTGNDKIGGGDGGDTLTGDDGNDRLIGGGGNDRLTGGRGHDDLSGGSGNDRFVLVEVADSLVAAGDRIWDWQSGDTIDLTAIDANGGVAGNQAFSFIGAAAFSGAGQLQVITAQDTFVQGDINGDGAADFRIKLIGEHNLNAGSFLL